MTYSECNAPYYEGTAEYYDDDGGEDDDGGGGFGDDDGERFRRQRQLPNRCFSDVE
jgi:hypothetical protein